VVEMQPPVGAVRILVNVVDTVGVESAGAANYAMDFIALA
jgi:hypothetical protein